MGKLTRAIGLMSGTSMDGIDVALLDTDGEGKVERGPGGTYPYAPDVRARLRSAVAAASGLERRDDRGGILGEVEAELTRLHADAVRDFLGRNAIRASAVDVIGFHGQTVLHKAQMRLALGPGHTDGEHVHRLESSEQPRLLTIQLGDGPALAAQTGIDVVYDLRAADCAAGGQGAPLVPAYHRALAIGMRRLPLAFVNVGGVANITYVGGDGRLIAFDTGPGNALIDDLVAKRTAAAHDADGALAASGRVHDDYVAQYMRHSYFATVPPKSLDRNAFALELVDPLSTEDAAATLTAFTATAIGSARAFLPDEPAMWIICGGGRRNRTLMRMIAANVENAVVPAEAVALDGDALEAEAWAYLAVRSVKALPITFPGTTGAPRPLTGGVLASVRR